MENNKYFDAATARNTANAIRESRKAQKFDDVASSDFFNEVIEEIKAQASDANSSAQFSPMPSEFYAESVKSGNVPKYEDCHFDEDRKAVFDVLESMMGYKVRFEKSYPAVFADPYDEPFKVNVDLVNVYW